MHPPPPRSIHLHPAPPSSIHLRPVHFILHPALCNTVNNIWTKILHLIGQFPRIRFLKFRPQNPFLGKFGPKIQRCPFCLNIGTHSISRMLIPNPDLDIWNFDPKTHFWANFGQKSQSWAQKCKVIRFVWKFVHIVSQGCRFWIRT